MSWAPERRICSAVMISIEAGTPYELLIGLYAAQALVAAGVGVTLLPRLALTALHPGTVARSLSDAPVRRVLAARMQGRFNSPASDAMLAILQSVADEFSGPRLELAAS